MRRSPRRCADARRPLQYDGRTVSEIQFDGQNYKWAYQISEEEERHQWFKLDQDLSQSRGTSELARSFPDRKAAPPDYDVSPKKRLTDFLTAYPNTRNRFCVTSSQVWRKDLISLSRVYNGNALFVRLSRYL